LNHDNSQPPHHVARCVATPVNRQLGQHVIIPPAVSDEVARQKFPNGWNTVKPYLRVVAQPRD
jgi:thioredoxin-dependent peroxiredoxin